MKRTAPLFIISLFFIHSCIAQLQIGIMGGPQFSIRYYTKSIADNGFITSVNTGITSLVPLSKKLSLHGVFGYSGKGVILKDFIYSDGGGSAIAGDINILLHYLELRCPINYSFALSSKTNLLVGTGPYFAYAIGGRQWIKENNYFSSFLNRELNFGNEYKRFEGGLTANVTLQHRQKWSLGIYSDIGLTNIFRMETSKNTSHRSFSFAIGYLFWQHKKSENKK